jgi:hypothetical protein
MEIPSYLLPRPPYTLTPEKKTAFDDLWSITLPGGLISYCLPYSKWEFLTYLCGKSELVLHGSQDPEIDIVQPQQAVDIRAFSNQREIYATTDGIWVIYFAILDRKRYHDLSLFNSCLQIRLGPDELSEPYYFFSITQSVKIQQPWCEGMVYILPRAGFSQEAPQQVMGAEVIFPHWISDQPAQPAARIRVGSQDFPFLDQIHGHDDDLLVKLYMKNPNSFPIEAVVS